VRLDTVSERRICNCCKAADRWNYAVWEAGARWIRSIRDERVEIVGKEFKYHYLFNRRGTASYSAGQSYGGGYGGYGGGYDYKAHSSAPPQMKPINTLYLTGFSHETMEQQVHSLVAMIDGFQGLNFVQLHGRSPHAFVLFRDEPAATAAMSVLSGQSVNGRPLRVQYAKSEMHKGVMTSGPGAPPK